MKRKLQVLNIENANTYVIIETVENSDVYVQFVPCVWLVPLKKNVMIKPRDSVRFYFPRRSSNQTKDYGFLKQSSCIGAAHKLVDFIKLNFRKGSGKKKKYVACMFVDLKRAFDTVDPVRMERKLRRIGLSQGASQHILSYLQNRRTTAVIGENSSVFRRIMVGVAQGSIMGPLHFIIYMNDILQLPFLGNSFVCR